MREVATIIVDKLNVHRVPGDRKTVTEEIVRRGGRYDVLERHSGLKASWLRIGDSRWIAERNESGDVFARIKREPDRADYITQDSSRLMARAWAVGAILFIVAVAGVIIFVR
jgi:hypothetical protein